MIALSLLERLVDFIEPAFLTAGYLIVATAVLLERSILLGLIIPGDVILALGGVYSAQGEMNVVAVIALGSAAALAGESIGYYLGRRYGLRLIRRIPLVRRFHKTFEESQEYFRRHGGKTVAIGRYATAAGAFIPFSAGMGRMPYRRFLLFDIPAVMVWAAGITIFGYVFGRNLSFVDRVLSRFGWVVLGLIVAFFVGRHFYLRYRRDASEEEGSGRSEHSSEEPERSPEEPREPGESEERSLR